MANDFPDQKIGRLRIAFVFNHHFFLGGGEVSFSELALRLDKSRFEPLIIIPGEGRIETQLKAQNLRTVIVPFVPLKEIVLGTPLRSLAKFIRILKGNRIDIIHANGSRACFYSVLAGRILGLPVLWHVRETVRDLYLYDGFMGVLAEKILCVSESVREKRFARYPRLIRDKTVVIHNGVDTGAFKRNTAVRKSIRSQLGIADENVLFGIVGNMIPLKGQDVFLQALAKAAAGRPGLEAKGLVIGRPLDPLFRGRLRQMVSDLSLENRVLFRDYTENVQGIYSALDVFVLPSRREGFSRSLLEAMSSGLPVLGTRISEIQEAVSEPRNALLVDYGDIEGMASAITKLVEDETRRNIMGQNNRKKAVQAFDIHTHARAVERIYREISSLKS